MLSMMRLYSVRWLDDRNGDELEMTWKKAVVAYSMYYPSIWVKPRKPSVTLAGGLADIRNKNLANTDIEWNVNFLKKTLLLRLLRLYEVT
jgi:hypothetical protein